MESNSISRFKEQLSERDLRIYELELRLKDLSRDVASLPDLKEKVSIANRNARVLEEENTSLQRRIKSLEGGSFGDTSSCGKQAQQLIKENDDLRASMKNSAADYRRNSDLYQQKEVEMEKQLRDETDAYEKVSKERDRISKELDQTRQQLQELTSLLRNERETSRISMDCSEQEMHRLREKIDELSTSRRSGCADANFRSPQKTAEPLREVFLREDVAQLESKLQNSEEDLRRKERLWREREATLQRELQTIRDLNDASSDGGILNSLEHQISLLKNEVAFLRKSQRPNPTFFPVAAGNADSSIPAYVNSSSASVVGDPTDNTKLYNSAVRENDYLCEEIALSKNRILELQSVIDSKDIRCKELEMMLANEKSNRHQLLSQPAQQFGASNNDALEKEIALLKDSLARNEILSDDRRADMLDHIEALQRDNDALLNAKVTDSSAGNTKSIQQLSKDNRETVEDIMRLLEEAWDENQNSHVVRDNLDKDDEIGRLREELSRATRLEPELIESLQRENRQKDDRIATLQEENNLLHDRLNREEELLKDLHRANRKKESLERDNDDLERQLSQLRKSSARSRDRERGRNSRRMESMAAENDRLRRDLASSARDEQSAQRTSSTPRRSRVYGSTALSQPSVARASEERKRNTIPAGAHLGVTIMQLSSIQRNAAPITEPGFLIIKLKSIKEKYKTSVKELSASVRFEETFMFYLAQPDQDVITLHIFYRSKNSTREVHIGDACFSMSTLHRGVPRIRDAPIVQNPGTRDALIAGRIQIALQTDDFGRIASPTTAQIEDEQSRFRQMETQFLHSNPEKLHAVDVYMSSSS